MATFTRRGKGWRAQVRVLGRYKSRTFHTRSAAALWARQEEDRIRAGNSEESPEIALGEAVDRYERERREHAPLSATIRGNLNRWKETHGEVLLGELEAAHIIEHAKGRKVSPATMTIEIGALRGMLQVAATWGVKLSADPVAGAIPILRKMRLVGKPKERDRRPSAGELERLYAYFAANTRMPMGDIAEFAIETAMREGEIARVVWDDLDIERKLLTIRDRKDPQNKDGNDQAIPLLGTSLDVILRQPRKDARIFPYHADSITRAWGRACKALGIVDLHFHDLRHEGTSRLFEQGYQIQEVAVVTGHRSWSSLKRYTNLRPESLHR